MLFQRTPVPYFVLIEDFNKKALIPKKNNVKRVSSPARFTLIPKLQLNTQKSFNARRTKSSTF